MMRSLVRVVLLATTTSLFASPVLAAEIGGSPEATDAAQGGNDIVVTAQRKEQRLQDVPISVSVAAGEDLKRASIRTLEDLTNRLPNIRISQVPGSDTINIRGVGSGNNLGFEQSVATFVDGVYRSRSRAYRLGFFDVERVEVLRGPQTTFFGNNAIAGAINITTRRPSFDLEYNASALYSPSDGEYSVEAGASIPLSDKAAIRIAGRQSGMDGYIRNLADNSDGPHLNDKVGRISLRLEPSDTLHIDARVDGGRLRDTGIYNTELLNCPGGSVFGAPRGACARNIAASAAAGVPVDDKLNHQTFAGPSVLRYDFVETALKVALDLPDHRLTSISSYFYHDFGQLVNVMPVRSGSVIPGIGFALPTSSFEKLNQFTQELRLESTGTGPISYMVGAYYLNGRLSALNRAGYYFSALGALAPGYTAADPIAFNVDNSQRDEVFSVFAASTIKFARRFDLNLGLRYSTVTKKASRFAQIGTSNGDLSVFVPVSAAAQAILLPASSTAAGAYPLAKRTDDKLMPSVSLQYHASNDLMLYASYARGFKAGGFAFGQPNSVFNPETVDSFEVGVKSSFLHGLATVNLTAFRSKYKDLQEATFTILQSGVPFGTIANVAASKSQGIELNGSLRIAQPLRFTFDVAWLDSKYTRYPLGPCTSLGSFTTANCTQDLSGTRRAYAPVWSGSVGLAYERPVAGGYTVNLDTRVNFNSRYFEQANGDPLSIQSGFAKLDARLGFGPDSRRWEFAVIGRNLTDKATASFRSPLPSSPGSYQGLPDRPRSVALQFSITG